MTKLSPLIYDIFTSPVCSLPWKRRRRRRPQRRIMTRMTYRAYRSR